MDCKTLLQFFVNIMGSTPLITTREQVYSVFQPKLFLLFLN